MSLDNTSKPTKEELEPLKDLEFVINDDMKETFLKLLTLQQMLNDDELSKRERKMIDKHRQELFNDFKSTFQQLNPTQVAIVRTFFENQKK